ncbi:MAG: metal-dependent transcriptional regulator [Synergistaceae bacterium]|jgi:DtxR family Mn-dependent transcriptional regulator|nr:metal-dependent transcriptional regulator [Synergistaceae bacterium]
MDDVQLTRRIEDYLEEIFLMESAGREITVTCLAERLKLTKGTVTTAAQKMAEAGMLIHERYGVMRLTRQGRLRGLTVYRRHEGLKAFFHELLGVDRDRAATMACNMEHYMDSVTDGRLYAMMDFFRTARGGREPWVDRMFAAMDSTVNRRMHRSIPLSAMNAGQEGVISHVSAEDEDSRARLKNQGFVQGASVKCLESSETSVVLSIAGNETSMPPCEASAIWVKE